MILNTFFKALRLPLLILASCFSNMIHGQAIKDRAFPNGALSDPYGCEMKLLGDTALVLSMSKTTNTGSLFHELSILGADDLSARKVLHLDTVAPNYYSLFSSIEFIGQNILLSGQTMPNGSSVFTVFSMNGQFDNYSVLFRDSSHSLPIRGARLIDDKVYTLSYTSKSDAREDSVEIKVFNMDGSLYNNRFHSYAIDSSWDGFHDGYPFGPYQHPLDTSSIVFGCAAYNSYFELDKQTLGIIHKSPPPPDIFKYGSRFISAYHFNEEGVHCAGTVGRRYNLQNPQNVYQSYFSSRKWNGDSIRRGHFGKTTRNERAYAYYVAKNGTQFLGAAAPFDDFMIPAPEFREAIIYRFGASTDSIKLYGNKNHVPYQLETDGNGNLYMLSTYTDAWTTDSTYFVITKIPDFAMSQASRPDISSRIQVFPNPATDCIRVSDLMEPSLNAAIYSQSGQLLGEGKIQDDCIPVHQLKRGTYILLLTAEDGNTYQAVFVKR